MIVPEDAKIFPAEPRRKRNPDYDESREYLPREDRDEWYLVGLLGQIPITKGQPVGSWTKMNEISDKVDMYYVSAQANDNKAIQELTAKVEALEWVSDFEQYSSNPLVKDLLAGNYKSAIETILAYNNK